MVELGSVVLEALERRGPLRVLRAEPVGPQGARQLRLGRWPPDDHPSEVTFAVAEVVDVIDRDRLDLDLLGFEDRALVQPLERLLRTAAKGDDQLVRSAKPRR